MLQGENMSRSGSARYLLTSLLSSLSILEVEALHIHGLYSSQKPDLSVICMTGTIKSM